MLECSIMARLQHTQLKTHAGKLKSDDNIQRHGGASDRHAFENALKVASAEKAEKIDNANSSHIHSEVDFNSNEQDDWYRYTSNAVLTDGTFQSAQYPHNIQENSASVPERCIHTVRDFYENQNTGLDICTKRLDEVSDWLDEMLDREDSRAGGWTFEFETDDAHMVELRLCCQQDGQWSACINLDTAISDQQELERMLSRKGVSLSWADIS